MPLTPQQYDVLLRPLNSSRIAKRSQGGKQLSYLESWDVRAHLIRVFGFTSFDVETLDAYHIATRDYMSSGDTPKPMVEVIWYAKVRLRVRGAENYGHDDVLCVYTESAVGSASGPANMLGEHHDNAVKTAASDAMKRCAINLGTQFGLSLYDNGSTRDVVRKPLVQPPGYEPPEVLDDQQVAEKLAHSLGATPVSTDGRSPIAPPLDEGVTA